MAGPLGARLSAVTLDAAVMAPSNLRNEDIAAPSDAPRFAPGVSQSFGSVIKSITAVMKASASFARHDQAGTEASDDIRRSAVSPKTRIGGWRTYNRMS